MPDLKATCWAVTYLTLRISIIIMGIILTTYAFKARDLSSINLNPVVQVIGDWTELPIVDIKVQQVACDERSEVDIFKYEWQGTDLGHLCRGTYGEKVVPKGDPYPSGTYEINNGSRGNNSRSARRYDCIQLLPINAITTDRVKGQYMCGVYGGISFEKVKRVDATGKCPTGT